MTKDGANPELGPLYGLIETPQSETKYRTELNVINSDATVLFGDMTSAGSALTIRYINKHKKPFLVNPTDVQLLEMVSSASVTVLNIAGNRKSKSTIDNTRVCLNTVFSQISP